MIPPILNTSCYKFIELSDERRAELQTLFKDECDKREIKGTIILAPEGVNIFLSGATSVVEDFWNNVFIEQPEFADIVYKPSWSNTIAFKRMKVRLRNEVIPMGRNIKPHKFTAPRVAPKELAEWLSKGSVDGKEVVMLDTRNGYELEYGTFDNAVDMKLRHFRDFPEAAERLKEELGNKRVVSFCTGGIRCEKAGALLMELGYNDVWQLDGGILKYFEDCGDAHYKGSCFVFDERVAVDGDLSPELDGAEEALATLHS